MLSRIRKYKREATERSEVAREVLARLFKLERTAIEAELPKGRKRDKRMKGLLADLAALAVKLGVEQLLFECPACQGAGKLDARTLRPCFETFLQTTVPCGDCEGKGLVTWAKLMEIEKEEGDVQA